MSGVLCDCVNQVLVTSLVVAVRAGLSDRLCASVCCSVEGRCAGVRVVARVAMFAIRDVCDVTARLKVARSLRSLVASVTNGEGARLGLLLHCVRNERSLAIIRQLRADGGTLLMGCSRAWWGDRA